LIAARAAIADAKAADAIERDVEAQVSAARVIALAAAGVKI
jgi:hypothetical protein